MHRSSLLLELLIQKKKVLDPSPRALLHPHNRKPPPDETTAPPHLPRPFSETRQSLLSGSVRALSLPPSTTLIATIGAERCHLHFEPKSRTTKLMKQIGMLNHRESSQNAASPKL
ncbi:hypothetical protein DEO72_LG5g1296 [Vigna unguiculata]|uniref:Uncharacterized protein n=1 Tax=Vigna unguiculata TaxID=3917 RepID=A0A4D6LZG4_VIGUN|nr:hypothetical protein DEO72_LG5g1296 [Vigna unguiculata]